jgi:hypothetical protein
MKKDSRTLTMMSSNGRGKASVVSSPGMGSKSVHRRDSAKEHSELERSGEQGNIRLLKCIHLHFCVIGNTMLHCAEYTL